MPTTPHWAIPYEAGIEAANGPQALQDIANNLDNHMKDLRGTYAARPAAAAAGKMYYATDKGILYRDTGSAWVAMHSIPFITSWPPVAALAVDGMVVDYVPVAGIIWRLRYRSADASTYKWNVLSAPPLFSEVVADETIASSTYAGLATAGPSITIPRDGDYFIEIGCNSRDTTSPATSATAFMSFKIGAATALDVNAISNFPGSNCDWSYFSHMRPRKINTTATTVILAQYRSSSTIQVTFRYRWMRARPVRII
jgi:hypothetical protein